MPTIVMHRIELNHIDYVIPSTSPATRNLTHNPSPHPAHSSQHIPLYRVITAPTCVQHPPSRSFVRGIPAGRSGQAWSTPLLLALLLFITCYLGVIREEMDKYRIASTRKELS